MAPLDDGLLLLTPAFSDRVTQKDPSTKLATIIPQYQDIHLLFFDRGPSSHLFMTDDVATIETRDKNLLSSSHRHWTAPKAGPEDCPVSRRSAVAEERELSNSWCWGLQEYRI